jgi:hypothetical protein
MCRNIKTLRLADGLPAHDDIHAAALQYVRKVSGYRTPSRLNADAFDAAVVEIAAITWRLLENLAARQPAVRRQDAGPRP